MDEKINQLFQIYQSWMTLAQEARYLANDEFKVKEKQMALLGYYTAIAEVWESAAGDLLQWIEEAETTKNKRK